MSSGGGIADDVVTLHGDTSGLTASSSLLVHFVVSVIFKLIVVVLFCSDLLNESCCRKLPFVVDGRLVSLVLIFRNRIKIEGSTHYI